MAQHKTASHRKGQTQSGGKRENANNGRLVDKRTKGADTGGVIAYTKGSRFKDAEVLKIVKRVLSSS